MKKIFGHPYFGFLPSVCSILSKVGNPLISIWENKELKEIDQIQSHWEPIFIVGAPRSGSTYLYQLLSNHFDLLYPDNLTAHFHHNPIFAFHLSNFFYKNKAHNSFQSEHGRTYSSGLHAPNEFTGFWYRWFPINKDHVTADEVTQETTKEMRAVIYSISNHFQKPILFKNLYNSLRLEYLHQVFPNAKIIFIQRNHPDQIQSILKARKRDLIDPNEWWSLKPPNYLELLKLPEGEQVAQQILETEKAIKRAQLLFKKDNWLNVSYEELINQPESLLRTLENNYFNAVKLRSCYKLQNNDR